MSDEVAIPSKAVSDDADVVRPTTDLLQGLRLLGRSEKEGTGLDSVFQGPPQSVALIEAGATAAAKWWAAGAGGAIVATWGAVAAWFNGGEVAVQVAALGAAGIVTAALVIAIGYLLGSDVRGRAQAATATIDARSAIARAMLDAAEALYKAPPAEGRSELVALPTALEVENHLNHSGSDAEHWHAVAMQRDGEEELSYIVVKGSAMERRRIGEIQFVTPTNGRPPSAPTG